MLFNRCQTQLLLVLTVLMPCGVGGDTECTIGSDCFPSGQVPKGLTDKDTAYYCCLERNTRRHQNMLPDGSQNCSCVDYFTAEEDIKERADNTEHKGRMCNEGKECEGITPFLTIERKFTYCCKTGPQRGTYGLYSSYVDVDKMEYILCRCLNLPVLTPDAADYLVSKTLTHNSTAESCSYDDGCLKYPRVKCQSSVVTFCCYGSRGIVTDNDAQGFTRCTCTNELYGERCEPYPIAIEKSSEVTESMNTGREGGGCLMDCDDKPAEKKCVDSNNHTKCCSNDLNVVATQDKGSFQSCTCSLQRQMNCDVDTSSTTGTGGHLGDVMVMAVMAAYLVARQTEVL